jgi:hypothetical protein
VTPKPNPKPAKLHPNQQPKRKRKRKRNPINLTMTMPTGFYAESSRSSIPPPPQPYAAQQQPGYSYTGGSYYPTTAPPATNFGLEDPNRKRPRPDEFTCKACKLTLDSNVALQAHLASHVTCESPGCNFEGSQKVVKGHFDSCHGRFSQSGFKTVTVGVPGLPVQRFKICVGNRPEDVQVWIAERRKRFPRNKPLDTAKTVETKGLASLLQGYDSSSSEDANEKKSPIKSDQQSAVPSPVAQDKAVSRRPEAPKDHRRPCRFFMRNGKCRNGDSCQFRHDPADQEQRTTTRTKAKEPNSLLRKLLTNDIRRERTLTFQLLEHIFETNFLQDKKPRHE